MSLSDANQPPPFEGRNLFLIDQALREGVTREGASWAHDRLTCWGATLGSAETLALATRANRFDPELRAFDRFGERIDEVAFDPAWHELMRMCMAEGEHAAPWAQPTRGAHVARAAAYLMHAEVENGTQCPLTMTFAATPVLQRCVEAYAWLADTWLPRLHASTYDPRALSVTAKRSALIGMGMTERQGGSDVRANTTRAARVGGGEYLITGHKWFFSAPMCDAHLVLAQADGGLSCFFLPRVLNDGTRNNVQIRRLKDKLGNRSNASAEVDFAQAHAWLLGDEGRGVSVIIEMVQHTRLDCAIGSTGLMRSAALQAAHHAAFRQAFGKRLVDHALMRNVIADLALETEAAIALVLRLARMFEPESSEHALARLITPAVKFWLCKRAPAVVAEALEVFGGNGYVEESVLPRLYREAPLNSIWEGSGNVMCLDVVRAARREPQAVEALFAELALARGDNTALDRHVAALEADIRSIAANADAESGARRLAGNIATALAASLLVRHASPAVADGYCASRLGENAGAMGMLPGGVDCAALVRRLTED